jgi:molybdate transport system substrate-binding protein
MRIFAGVALVLSFCGGARAADLKIAAAANLQKVLTDSLIPAFEKQSGATVTPTFGSTKLLAKQLENGAPEDVFVSADTDTVTKLVSEGQLDGSTEKVYAIGRLVMWTLKDARLHPRRIQDLANPAYAKIAIANPKLAPYGLAARQSFDAAGLTASVTPRLAVAENIAQSLQYARSGNADVSLTALALVIDDKDDPYVIVPDKLHAPIAQAAAVVKASRQQDLARRFLAFLTSKAAAPIWKQYGYELPK